jgi:hypothetical protein
VQGTLRILTPETIHLNIHKKRCKCHPKTGGAATAAIVNVSNFTASASLVVFIVFRGGATAILAIIICSTKSSGKKQLLRL